MLIWIDSHSLLISHRNIVLKNVMHFLPPKYTFTTFTIGEGEDVDSYV